MKKVVLLAVAVSASAAWADFYINFHAGYGFSVDPVSDPTGNIPLLAEGERATVQLIYAGANGVPDFDSAAANAAGGTTYTLSAPYAVAGDDVLLAQFLTDPATSSNSWSRYAIFQKNVRAPYRGSGLVYGRIFNAAGTEWFQQPGVFAASDVPVDAVPPPAPGELCVRQWIRGWANPRFCRAPAQWRCLRGGSRAIFPGADRRSFGRGLRVPQDVPPPLTPLGDLQACCAFLLRREGFQPFAPYNGRHRTGAL